MYVGIATHCTAGNEAERYDFEAIAGDSELATFEEHLLVCHIGQNELVAVDQVNAAITRAAFLDIVPLEIHAVHETIEGEVYLWVSEDDEGCWTGRIQGCEVDSGHIANSRLDAIRHNDMTFRSMFFEHACSPRCVRHE